MSTICGAKTRAGTPCKNPPTKRPSGNPRNGRCRLHGGNQPQGADHHRFKHGAYSQYVGESLKEVLEELEEVSTEDLIQPEAEIRLMSALIKKCTALETGLNDLTALDTISKTLSRLIAAKQRSQAILLEQKRLIPAEDVAKFMQHVDNTILKEIDSDKAFTIIDKIQHFRLTDAD